MNDNIQKPGVTIPPATLASSCVVGGCLWWLVLYIARRALNIVR
jgi:hypothetical protein